MISLKDERVFGRKTGKAGKLTSYKMPQPVNTLPLLRREILV